MASLFSLTDRQQSRLSVTALNAGKEKEKKAWEGYGEFNFENGLFSPTIEEAEQILRDAGVELKPDGTNAEQVGLTLSEKRFAHWEG